MDIRDTGADRISWLYSVVPDTVCHAIALDGGRTLFVVSAKDWGDYEWILAEGGTPLMHSDDAYGSPERALMHGLNACDKDEYL